MTSRAAHVTCGVVCGHPPAVQRFIAIIVFACVKNGASVSAFTCMFLLTNNTVPARRRGAVNGFAMTVASAGKALAPAFAGNVFACACA